MSTTREIYNNLKTGAVKANNRSVNKQIKDYKKSQNAIVTDITSNTDKYIDTLTDLTGAQNRQLTATTDKAIEATRQNYQKAYDYNAINQELQQRQIADRMANMGLTNSGLNMTNQTALAVSRMNNDASVTQKYNNAVSTLRSNLQQLIAENNNNLSSNIAQVEYDSQNRIASVNEEYNRYIADLKAGKRKDNFNIISGLKNNAKSISQTLIASVTSTSDKSQNAQTIFSAAKTYGLSDNSIKRLLNMAGISWNDYQSWIENRSFFANATVKSGGKKKIDEGGVIDDTKNPKKSSVGGVNYNKALQALNMHYRSPDGTVMSAKTIQNYIDSLANDYNLTDKEKDALEEVITDRYDVK